jgi:ribose 5-phosphate isomerase A
MTPAPAGFSVQPCRIFAKIPFLFIDRRESVTEERALPAPPLPDLEREKELAAARSLEHLRDGMTIGLGTGSTAAYFIQMLARRVQEGLRIKAVPTSLRTQTLARRLGIPLTDFAEVRRLDLTVDGADEVNPQLDLIKGGGGALLREKIVASVTDYFVIIGDSRKFVPVLGRFPLPVEVVPFGWQLAAERIERLGAEVTLRANSTGQPFLTVESNFILDCRFGSITDPAGLARELRGIIGVVEHGLFVGMASELIIGRGDTTEILTRHQDRER